MHDVEIAKNAATNGRWFNAMVFALLVAMGDARSDDAYFIAAIGPILSVGAAYVGDLMRLRWAGWLSVAFAVLPLLVLIVRGF